MVRKGVPIRIKRETRERLRDFKKEGETYNDTIQRMFSMIVELASDLVATEDLIKLLEKKGVN